MRRFRHWLWHVVTGMVQGCLVLAILAAAVSVAATTVATHHLPQGVTLTLIVAIVAISGLLGAAGMLAWRLSHIGELVHLAEEVTHPGERL
jgi:amino acid transporter